MKFTFDHDLHIHSKLSSCSQHPEQTTENILAYAKKNGLTTICLTDHYWDERVEGPSDWYAPQNTPHIKEALPLPQAEGIRFLFGCETDLRADMTVGISKERFEELDFVIIPTTHMHMKDFTVPEGYGGKPEMLARLWVEKLDALLAMDLPFQKIGLAHLACPLIGAGEKTLYGDTLRALSNEAMRVCFKKIADKGAGVEINKGDFNFHYGAEDEVLRMFRIAKEEGCKFYLGTDAHAPKDFETAKAIFERAIDLLGLEENDKFKI